MKIKKIFIDGFGEYHKKSLSLDKDITVFKGSNEAGKTTVLEFVRTVFFGFDKRKATKAEWFKPLHGGRHGGYVEIENDSGSIYRIERYRDRTETISVLDANGQNLGEHTLHQMFSGIDRKVFEQKYAFGIYDLGNTSDFDINQKLYDAGIGAEGLGLTLAEFEKEKKELFSSGKGTKNKFAQASLFLDEKEKQIIDIISRTEKYAEKQDEKKVVVEKENTVGGKINELRLQKSRIENLQKSFPVWKELQLLQVKLQDFEKYKYFPVDAEARLNKIENQIKGVAENFAQANKKFLHYKKACTELIVNQEILDDADQVINLSNDLKSFFSSVEDLPKRERTRDIEEHKLQEKIKELSDDWGEDDLISFDTSLTMSEEIKKFAKDSEALNNPHQEAGLTKYSALIQGAVLVMASLGLFFENVVERFISLSIGGIAIVLWNLWVAKKTFIRKNDSEQLAFSHKWEEFKRKYNFPLPVSPERAVIFLDEVRQAKAIQVFQSEEIRKRVNAVKSDILDFTDQTDILAKKHGFSRNNNQAQEYIGLARRIIKSLEDEKQKIRDRENYEIFLYDSGNQRQKHEDDLKSLEESLKDLLSEVGCDSKIDFENHARHAVEFKRLQNDVIQKKANILMFAGSETVENFQIELSGFVPELAQHELNDIAKQLDEFEIEKNELNQRLGEIKLFLKEIEEENEIQEIQLEKSFIIKELKEYALDWCKLRIAEEILKSVQKKRQDEKQPAVIKLATKYFKNITFGKYTKIYVDNQDLRNPVKVLQNDDQIKAPNVLSGGTKDQLFLSMRLGEIVNYTKSSNAESLPVIFDDILVNSDIERSSKITDTILEVSKENQIIYFTFNQSVIEGFSNLGNKCEIIEL